MPRRVLVVDDEPDILDLLTIWLDDDPRCSVCDRATDLSTALEQMAARCPDTILLDLNVGTDSSASAIPVMRALAPRARIIVHTANTDEAHAADVMRLGADLVLEKATVSVEQVIEAALVDEEGERGAI